MKCTLIVISGKERSQRSCEMTERLTTREQVVTFLKRQDLRLESSNFDYTVSFDGKDDARSLKTDADVRLFLAQARQLGGKATFHICLRCDGAIPADMESFLSAEYAVDLDLVTLRIYTPLTTATTESEKTLQWSPSDSNTYHEKMFVVPTRFVLDGLLRAVKDTLSADTLTKDTRLTIYTLSSSDDTQGVALSDDAAALNFLHAQAKKREPAMLTYAFHTVQSPFARHASQQPQELQQQPPPGEAVKSHSAAKTPQAAPAVDDATPIEKNRRNTTLPPLTDTSGRKWSVETSAAPGTAATPVKSNGVTPDAPQPKYLSTSAEIPGTARASGHSPSPVLSANTPYRAFLREPMNPTAVLEVPVEVRMEETQMQRIFRFSYLKTEIQLCRRFSAECGALLSNSTSATGGNPVLTLSSDPSVVIDGDGTLRELLALAREAQQPLQVRVRFASPPKGPRPSPANRSGGNNTIHSNDNGETSLHRVASLKDVQGLEAVQPDTNKQASLTAASALPKDNRWNRNETSVGVSVPQQRLPSLSVRETHTPHVAVADGENTKNAPLPSREPTRGAAQMLPTSSPSFRRSKENTIQSTAPAAVTEVTETGGDPPPAVFTVPGPSTSASDAFVSLHPCFCEDTSDKDDSSSIAVRFYRCQAATLWGTDQRITFCRVRKDHVFEDLCQGVLATFHSDADRVATPAPATALTMEFVLIKDGMMVLLPLNERTVLVDLLEELFVENSELRVTSPPLPPFKSSFTGTPFKESDAVVSTVNSRIVSVIAPAMVHQLRASSLSLTSKEVHTLMCSLLKGKCSVEPFKAFLSKWESFSKSNVFSPSEHEAGGSVAGAATAVQKWFEDVLTDLSFLFTQAQSVLQEIASSLLCCELLDESNDVLDSFFTSVSTAFTTGELVNSTGATLHSLWQHAMRRNHTDSPALVNMGEAPPSTGSEWKAAFINAPSSVLDVLSAARMDALVKVFSAGHTSSAALGDDAHQIWGEAYRKAQLHFCELMAPGELESYFKSTDEVEASLQHRLRAVLLSCMGALLAPTSAMENYADWLVGHFCGRVGAVLYAKMGSFDGRTVLSLPALTILSWTSLHPVLHKWVAASAHRALLEKLSSWLRVAVEHACWVRRVTFPPWPLHGVHLSQPTPLCKYPVLSAPGVVELASMESEKAEVKQVDGCSPSTPAALAKGKAEGGVPAAPFACSPPSLTPSQPAASAQPPQRKASSKRIQYVYRYNFNALHLPRPSAS